MGAWQRVVGLDFVDTVIHVGATIAVASAAAWAMQPDEPLAVGGCVAASFVLFGWRRQRALRERPPAPSTAEVTAARDETLALMEQRVAELEERLDFAERLLARQAERGELPPVGGGNR